MPGIVVGSGSVTAIDPEKKSFTWTASQYITGATQTETISVRAIFTDRTIRNPVKFSFPSVHGLVSFTGRLLSYDDAPSVPMGTILLDSITFLTPGRDKSITGCEQQQTDSDQDADSRALNDRIQRYARVQVADKSNTSNANTVSPPAVRRVSKRKATEVEDKKIN